MTLPPRYEGSYDINKICRLKKGQYGLKQSPRAWFSKFTLTMKMLDTNSAMVIIHCSFNIFKQGELKF